MTLAGCYLDHAATSPMRKVAVEAFLAHADVIGNASALHRAGQRAKRSLEDAREQLASVVGAHPTEVVITSGGSESDSMAVLGSMAARRRAGRDRALVSAIEHPAVLGATAHGAEVMQVTSRGVVDTSAGDFDERLAVVSVMTVNNETGILQPVAEVVEAAHRVGAWMHSDAVQALGHVPLDFATSGVDMMSISAHKVGGPVGIGALLVRRDVTPSAIGLGGGQERDLRSGTHTVALAAAFAAAAAEAVANLGAEAERLGALQAQIVALAHSCGAHVSTVDAPHAPHIVNATFPGLRASDMLFLLDRADVWASVGSACRAGVHQPSEVLLAMGRTPDDAAATVRFSLGHTSTQADVDRLSEVLRGAVDQARRAG